MTFKEERPYAEPELAARKLLDLVRASIAKTGLPHAHIGSVNSAFLKDGGSVDEYIAGRKYATDRKWFEIDRSHTRIILLADGAE